MNIWCRLRGHKYVVTKSFSRTCRQLKCTRCSELFAMNDRVKALLPWDGEFDELHGTCDWPPNSLLKRAAETKEEE